MSGKTTGLTPLEMRKQLLVVESELNRAYLVAECQEVKKGIDHVTGQIAGVVSMAESVAKIGTTFTSFLQGFSSPDESSGGGKPSWLSNIFKAAKTGMSLWTTLWPGRR